MKLAIVRTGYSPINTTTYNVQEIGLAKGLITKNITIDIYSKFSDITTTKVISSENGCEIRLIPLTGFLFFQRVTFIYGLKAKIKKGEYDVVQLHEDSQLMTPIIIKYCKRNNIKLVLYQGMYQDYSGIKRIIQKVFDFIFKKSIQKNTDIILAKTTSAKAYLESKGYTNVKIVQVGIDILESKEYDDNDFNNFVQNYEKRLLYIGKIEKRRNPLFLIDLLVALRKLQRNVGLIIVGDGPLYQTLIDYSTTLGVAKDIFVIKSIENVKIQTIFKKSDIFLLPSNYEIFGMVVLEALYNEVPVIATQTAGPIDILIKKEYGSCLPLKLNSWVDAVLFYFDYENSIKNERKNYILEKYNWNKIAETYNEIVWGSNSEVKIENEHQRILFLPNWTVTQTTTTNLNLQEPNKFVKGQGYWFFKHFTGNNTIEIIDIQKQTIFHKFEKRIKFYFVQALIAFKNDKNIDIVISHGAQSGLVYSLLKTLFFKKKPLHIIFDIGGMNGARNNKIEKTIIQFALRSNPHIICHSKVIIENYRQNYPEIIKNTRYIPFGVNPEEFIPDRTIQVKNQIFSFGFAKRDYDTLIKSWQQVDHKGCKLRIAGVSSLPLMYECQDIKLLGILDLEQLKFEIQSAQFVVIPLPIYKYSYGQMSFMQSMCLGKTVIVTKTPSTEDYLINGEGAYFVKPYDVEDLKDKINYLLTNNTILDESNQKARKFIENNHTEAQMAMRIYHFIKDIQNENNTRK
jgi:glycosyltransferase involved in cell wall biosynthesis